jgi:hypothetical protein
MKRFAAILFASILLSLTSCLEMGDSTTINSDGSGMFVCNADLSGTLKMAFEKEKSGSMPPFKNVTTIDTTVYLRDIVREMDWPEENKRLTKEMMLKTKFDLTDHDKPVFTFSLSSSFGKQEDLNAMASLIRSKDFNNVIENAFKAIPAIDEKDMKEFGEMTQFLFRAMYKTTYQKGRIECVLDTTSSMYEDMGLGDTKLKEAIEAKSDHEEFQMMKACNFSTVITLPVAPKEIKGAAITKGEGDKQIVLKGTILDLLKDPRNYEYSIRY